MAEQVLEPTVHRPKPRRDLIVEVDNVFSRGYKKADVRGIGRARQAEYAEFQRNLRGGPPLHECSDAVLALTKIDRDMARPGNIMRCTLMDPVLFFYLVAVFEDAMERNPDLLLLRGDGPRTHDAGRRAKLRPMHILLVYLRYAKTNMSQHEVGLEFGVCQKTASSYIRLAKDLLSRALPTPHAYARHIRGLKDPREIKRCLPGPGRGACIEDGMLSRMKRSGQRKARDTSYNGRKKMHCANTLFRFNLRGEAVWQSPTVNGTVHDKAMCERYRLDLGPATANVRDKDAPPGDKFHRIHDDGFRGVDKVDPGAACEKTVGYKTLQKMDEAGRRLNSIISRKRLPSEWFFARLKRNKRFAEQYAGTYSELGEDLGIGAGLVNLHLMFGGVRHGSGHAKGPVGKRWRRHRRNLNRDKVLIDKAAGVKPAKKKPKKKRAKKKPKK